MEICSDLALASPVFLIVTINSGNIRCITAATAFVFLGKPGPDCNSVIHILTYYQS